MRVPRPDPGPRGDGARGNLLQLPLLRVAYALTRVCAVVADSGPPYNR